MDMPSTQIHITLLHPELAARFLDFVVAVRISQLGSVTLKDKDKKYNGRNYFVPINYHNILLI